MERQAPERFIAGEIAHSQWVFAPGMKEGRPVPIRMRLPFRFTSSD